MEASLFSLKGHGNSLRLIFESSTAPGIIDALRSIRDAGELLLGHPLVLDFKELEISRNWLLNFLRDVVFPMNLTVVQWASTNNKTLDLFSSLGFSHDGSDRPVVTQSSLKIVTTPLRSGQVFEHDGDVLMLCNLHAGAEVRATGSIIVLGELCGGVHAGCNGDNSASVIALSYKTNQMRIGTMISNAMEPLATPWWGKPVRLFVANGLFVASDLKPEGDR